MHGLCFVPPSVCGCPVFITGSDIDISVTMTERIGRKCPSSLGGYVEGELVFPVTCLQNSHHRHTLDCLVLFIHEPPDKDCIWEAYWSPCLFCFHRKHRRARDRSRSSSSSSQSSHSYKAEEYTEETEEREESATGFDKSRLGTKDFAGPSERGGRARGAFVRLCPPFFKPFLLLLLIMCLSECLFCCPWYRWLGQETLESGFPFPRRSIFNFFFSCS